MARNSDQSLVEEVIADRYDPVAILHGTTRVLAKSVLFWLSLLMSFALFGYTIYRPETPRIVAASIFMVVSLAFVALWEKKR